MAPEVEVFYDEFSRRFVQDIVRGNERVCRQLGLLSNVIPTTAQSILVIGFGSGQVAHHLAGAAPDARIVALDISGENLRMAEALFPSPRVTYQKLDITKERLEGSFEAIVLPDVYEHIPVASRSALHSQLNRLLGADGRIILTLPSPGHQNALRELGQGLQIIDEKVTLDDLTTLAADVGASLTYFNSISVWRTNDYVHAVIERDAGRERPMTAKDRIPLKGWPRLSVWRRAWRLFQRRSQLIDVQRAWTRRRIEQRLSRARKLS